MKDSRDIEWARRIKQGDSKAENEVIIHYQERLQYFIKDKIGHDNEDWNDIAQQTFLTTIQKLRAGSYEPQVSKLGTYIYGIMQRNVRNYHKKLRQQKRRRVAFEQPDNALIQRNTDYLSNLARDEQFAIVKQEVARLPAKYREIMDLWVSELKVKEIAIELNLAPTLVSQRKHRALEILRNKLLKKLK